MYYTYAYLRENRTPYYIGKGKGNRIFNKNKGDIRPPKDKSRIIFLKKNLTEAEAFRHEIYMIAVFGRKDLGTGILRNRTDGGEGVSGISEETRRKISEATKGEKNHNYGKPHSEEHKRKLSEAHQKYHYIIYSKFENKTYETNSISAFCRKYSLNNSHIFKTLTGERKHHKGFKIIKRRALNPPDLI